MYRIEARQNLSRVWVPVRSVAVATDAECILAAADYGKAHGFNPSTIQIRILDGQGTVIKTHCEAQKCHRF